MSIIFKSQTKQLIAKGYNAKLKYTEGSVRIPLPVIEFKNYKAFAETLTFTFTVDNTSGFLINMGSTPSTNSNNISIQKNGDVYTLSGVNWKFMKEHLRTLYIETYDDMQSDFNIDVSVHDGVSTPLTGQYIYTAKPVVDNIANGTEPTLTHADIQPTPLSVLFDKDTAKEELLELRVDDQSGPQTAKNYKVTLSTVPDVLTDYRNLVERTNISNSGTGYVFQSKDLNNFNLLHTFHSESIKEEGLFGSKVESDFSYDDAPKNLKPNFNVSFHGTTGESYKLRTDSCKTAGWDKTGDLDLETTDVVRSGSYSGDFTVEATGYPHNIDGAGYYDPETEETLSDVVVVVDGDIGKPVILKGFDTDVGDYFGWAVHVSTDGNKIFVTAPNDTDEKKGTVYVFSRVVVAASEVTLPSDSCGLEADIESGSTSWVQTASWNAPTLIDNTRFGVNFKVVDKVGDKSCCIAPIMGEYIFVIAEEPDKSGAVYVYRTSDEQNWALVETLVSPTPQAEALFGKGLSCVLFRDSIEDQVLEIYVNVGEPNSNIHAEFAIDEDTNALTVIGDQNGVNTILNEVEYFININNDAYNLVFTQEVTSGNQFTPYIQEQIITDVIVKNGLIVNDSYIYNEDEILFFTPAQFNLDIVDSGTEYEIQLIASDQNLGYISQSNFTGTPTSLNSEMTDLILIPRGDYIGTFTLDLELRNLTDNINFGITTILFTVGETHDEFSHTDSFSYNEDETLNFRPGQITDRRADVVVTQSDDIYEAYVLNLTPGVSVDDFILASVEPEDDEFDDLFVAEVVNIPDDVFHVPLYQVDLTLSDPSAGVLTPSTMTGTKTEVNAELLNIDFTPSADYTGNFDITYRQQQTTDSVDQGSAIINVTIGNTHDEFSLNNNFVYNEDETLTFNVGRITDLRPDNIDSNIQYQVDLTLSDPSAGVLTPSTMTGTKTEVNALLKAVEFTPGADYTGTFDITYSQLQTTDSLDHGSAVINVTVGNTHDEFSLNNNFVYNEDETVTLNVGRVTDLRPDNIDSNIQYQVDLTLSDPSAGVLTPSTITGTKAQVNEELLNIDFTPSADYTGNFDITYSQQQTTDSVDQGSAVINVTVGKTDTDNGYKLSQTSYGWSVNSNTRFLDFATITDTRGDNFENILYRIEVKLLSPASHIDGELRSFGAGGTSTWDNIDTLTIEGSKEEAQLQLDTIEWWSRGTEISFSYESSAYRQIDGTGFVLINTSTAPATEVGVVLPSPSNTNLDRFYDEDVKTSFSDADKISGESFIGPRADFIYQVIADSENKTIEFTDVSLAGDTEIISWAWDFGDGNTSTEQNPTHTFADYTTYDVQLTVVDNNTLDNSVIKQVTTVEDVVLVGYAALPRGLNTGTTDNWRSVVTDRTGVFVAVGQNGIASRSADNGETWTSIVLDTSSSYLTVATDRNGVWIAGAVDGNASRSVDNGITWTALEKGLNTGNVTAQINGLGTDGAGTWLAVCENGYASRSVDNGITWTALDRNLGESTNINYYEAHKSGNNWVVLGFPETVYSTDNGDTWNTSSSPVDGFGMNVNTESGTVIIGGFSSRIARSTDNGVTFSSVSTPSSGTNYRVPGIDITTNKWLMGGSKGVAVQSLDDGVTWTAAPTGLGNTAEPLTEIRSIAGHNNRFVTVQQSGYATRTDD